MNKISALFKSRRFWTAVSGVIVIAAQQLLGLSEAEAITIAGVLVGWIVGDSLKNTE